MDNPQNRLFEFLQNMFKDEFNMIFTSQPATIVSFDVDENTVNCTLDKEGITLKDIPISLFGNPKSYITTPTLEAGTKGLLIFSKHDLYSWVEDGVDKEAKTDFSKNNAFFLIGATNQKNKIPYNMNAVEIKTDKAIEIEAIMDISLTSSKAINMTSTLTTNINAKSINGNATDDIKFSSKNVSVTGSTMISLSAPKISITATASGNELIGTLKGLSDDLKGLATTLSNSKDMTYQLKLTNHEEISSYIDKFQTTSSKLGGFS